MLGHTKLPTDSNLIVQLVQARVLRPTRVGTQENNYARYQPPRTNIDFIDPAPQQMVAAETRPTWTKSSISENSFQRAMTPALWVKGAPHSGIRFGM
jgi:hypothetical protein